MWGGNLGDDSGKVGVSAWFGILEFLAYMIQEKQISWLGVERAHRQVKSLKCQIVTRLVGFKGFLTGFYTSLKKTTSRSFTVRPWK